MLEIFKEQNIIKEEKTPSAKIRILHHMRETTRIVHNKDKPKNV
jgi:uncharacterized protein YPO0396